MTPDGPVQAELPAFRTALADALRGLAISVAPEQMEKLQAHYAAMIAANQSINLTRITDPIAAAVKHYADSLALLKWPGLRSMNAVSLLDIGTGAGFPALPLAVMCPDWSVTALDGTRKKTDFLAQLARQIGLDNLVVEHGHSDHWEAPRRFDMVATRAVGSLNQSLRSARSFLAIGGRVVAYKTADLEEDEIVQARRCADELSMTFEPSMDYELALSGETIRRSLRIARVIEKTSSFKRHHRRRSS